MSSASPLEAVAVLAPRLRAAADATERARRLAPELVSALADAGVFRLCVPRAAGGLEAAPATLLEVLEALAAADGSAGWVAMIGATTGLMSAYLAPATARAIYGERVDVVTGGVYAPIGRAVPSDGGWRLTGRWPFASGCEHCQWLMGGALAEGRPRFFLFPAREAAIVDTWDAAGLRGTGSHDIVLDDCFVPAGHVADLLGARPQAEGALFAFPLFGLLALGIAAVAIGIARRSVEELTALAVAKTPTGSRRRLAERGVVQAEVAKAEALVASARAYVDAAVARAWDAARAGMAVDVALRMPLRLAATHAAHAAADAVDLMYRAGGGTSVYATSPLQRCFRDVHVLTQHAMVASATWELAGRLRLGLPSDTSML